LALWDVVNPGGVDQRAVRKKCGGLTLLVLFYAIISGYCAAATPCSRADYSNGEWLNDICPAVMG
jgi:hypothetical protein